MTLELLSNAFVFSADDAAQQANVLERMSSCGAFTSVREHDGWCIGEAAFSRGPAQPAAAAQLGMVFVQAPPELLGSPNSMAELRNRLLHDPASTAAISGDVGLVALDQGAAHLMRPAAGRVPWYWTSDGSARAAGTRLAYFYHLLGLIDIDPFVHATWSANQTFPDGRSPLAGVRLLAPGHSVVVGRAGALPPVRYWDPFAVLRSRPTPATTEAFAAELRHELIGALERELDPDEGNLLGLSGGVDSSSLAALAVRAAGRPLATFSHVPAQDHPSREREFNYIDSLIDELGISSSWKVPLSPSIYLEAQWEAPRIGMPVPHQALGHLHRFVSDHGCAVLTGGELADDLFGGAYVLQYDWLASFSLVQLAGRLRRPGILDRPRRTVVNQWLETRWRRRLGRATLPVVDDLPNFVLPELRDEYREWRSRCAQRIAALDHPYRLLQATLENDGWLVMNWEACSALGVRRSVPFVTRPVIELALRCHPQEHAEPSKRLLRIGLRGDVPALNLGRPDKGGWGAIASDRSSMEWHHPLPDRLEQLVWGDWMSAPPPRLSFDDASALTGLILGTEPPGLVPIGGVDR